MRVRVCESFVAALGRAVCAAQNATGWLTPAQPAPGKRRDGRAVSGLTIPAIAHHERASVAALSASDLRWRSQDAPLTAADVAAGVRCERTVKIDFWFQAEGVRRRLDPRDRRNNMQPRESLTELNEPSAGEARCPLYSPEACRRFSLQSRGPHTCTRAPSHRSHCGCNGRLIPRSMTYTFPASEKSSVVQTSLF
jgi:hypothetical protein